MLKVNFPVYAIASNWPSSKLYYPLFLLAIHGKTCDQTLAGFFLQARSATVTGYHNITISWINQPIHGTNMVAFKLMYCLKSDIQWVFFKAQQLFL